jgi:hypothetical protein
MNTTTKRQTIADLERRQSNAKSWIAQYAIEVMDAKRELENANKYNAEVIKERRDKLATAEYELELAYGRFNDIRNELQNTFNA